ncbi:hypothetical protein J7E87_15645 [Streptomyces sp. ISL-1]|uniref:hypothetical protein n=1 Tax=Streptomyces sp. ISL-1 TaxID=2817657 RepID=UPI001BE8058E|nr:hypothetical protein [Streptomyces sp. ISL-1]MBT2390816.1 hypothetical protein [Streptomyces sp. ISL-1]
MGEEHLVLDSPTLLALRGNKQVSGLIHYAHTDEFLRLWVPVLAMVDADTDFEGIAEHVGQMEALGTVPLDYADAVDALRLRHSGLRLGCAAAVVAVRSIAAGHAPGAVIATVEPQHYDGFGVAVMDLNR